jgi:hypothetical protein
MGLDELDAIAEGIGSEGSIETLDRFGIVLYFEACISQGLEKSCEVTDDKCRMRFPGWAKVSLDAEV